jgi:prolyl 4-hydroxylase
MASSTLLSSVFGYATPQAQYKNAETLSYDPAVAVIDDFVDSSSCSKIIELASGQMSPAKVSSDAEPITLPSRSNSNCWLQYQEDSVPKEIGEKLSELVGIPLSHAESLQVIHYLPGQEYQAHYDAYELLTARGQRCCKWGHQRIVTALLYLNQVEGGGSTKFPKLGIDVLPKPGKVLVFNNVGEDLSMPHPDSLHAGCPVTQGEKWACNIWFRSRPMSEEQSFD